MERGMDKRCEQPVVRRLQRKLKISGDKTERPRMQHSPRILLSTITFAGELILRRHRLPMLRRLLKHIEDVARRLLTNLEVDEKLIVGLRAQKGLLNNPEDAENLIIAPRLFGAKSFHLSTLPPLLLTLETWMQSEEIFVHCDSWKNEIAEAQRLIQYFYLLSRGKAHSTGYSAAPRSVAISQSVGQFVHTS